MFAKQTIASAALVVVVGGARLARAEPATDASTGTATPTPTATPPPMPTPPPTATPPLPPLPPPRSPTGTFSIGAGYGTDDGFSARATVAQTNLFGTGDLVALDARISERHQRFEGRFRAPHLLDTDLELDATLYRDRRTLPGLARDAVGGAMQLSHDLDDHVRAYVGYRVEHVTPDAGLETTGRAIDPTETYPSLHAYNLATLRLGLGYSTLDAPVLPSRGSSLGAELEVADPRLGSDIRFTRVEAWASTHQPLGPFTVHLGGRVTAIGSEDAHGVPSMERLYLDGSRDLPGFHPGALGPPIGGNLEALGRAELELPIARSLGLSLVGFYTVGSIYDWKGNGGFGQSVGLGLLWRSPIGPLRIDFAIPIGGGPPALVFGLGGSF